MNLQTIYLLLGLMGIWISAGIVVINLQKIAKAINMTEAFIGLTVLSIATSLPEIFTHLVVSMDVLNGIDTSNIAIGSNIGSNIVQITFIMGLIGLMVLVKSHQKILKIDSVVMLSGIILLFVMCLNGKISRSEGFILTFVYIGYLIYLTKGEKIFKNHHKLKDHTLKHTLLTCMGLALLLYSAKVVVTNADALAALWGVRDSFIGSIVIGLTTALPELTVAIRAILKGSTGMSLGTLIGSNITNPLFALGIGAMVSGYTVDKVITFFDIPFWFFVSLLVIFFFKKKMKLDKPEAVTLILLYLSYLFIKIMFFA
tara:strand:+ start:1252 stop:2193 length:942 start_codon:yes stop_codon:yes gene_type:complete